MGTDPSRSGATHSGSVGAMVAHRMNGGPLTPDHGFPLRSLVPGYIGARSVKWLGKIVVSDRPSPNHYFATAYKIVRSNGPIDWQASGPIYRYPINGVIASPSATAQLSAGKVTVTGYVLPSGRPGARADRILVSADGGRTWIPARKTGKDHDYCWQLFAADVPVTSQTDQLLLRAEDNVGGLMPQRGAWNAKGYLQNSWYHRPVHVSP